MGQIQTILEQPTANQPTRRNSENRFQEAIHCARLSTLLLLPPSYNNLPPLDDDEDAATCNDSTRPDECMLLTAHRYSQGSYEKKLLGKSHPHRVHARILGMRTHTKINRPSGNNMEATKRMYYYSYQYFEPTNLHYLLRSWMDAKQQPAA